MTDLQNPMAPRLTTATVPDADLQIDVRPSSQALLVEYRFTNRSRRTAFLFNVIHRAGPSGNREPDVNLVYVQLAGDSVVLSKKIIPVPPDIDVEKPDVPYVTRVDPGQTFAETINAPLPLKLYAPYETSAAPVMGEAEVWFELGFFLAPDPSVARKVGNRLVVYPFPVDKQLILRRGPLGRFAVSS